MIRTTDTLDALYRAILAQPGEDTPRLVYADALDELAGTETVACPTCSPYADEPCPRCNGAKVAYYPLDGGVLDCRECDGTGKYPPGYLPSRDPASGRQEGGWTNCKTCNDTNNGSYTSDTNTPGFVTRPDEYACRALFIRTQIALEPYQRPGGLFDPPRDDDDNRRFHQLVQVQNDLLTVYGRIWRSCGPCQRCVGPRPVPPTTPCPVCLDTGQAGALSRRLEANYDPASGTFRSYVDQFVVQFRRGFVARIDAPLDAVMACGGSGYHDPGWIPSALPREWLAAHPIEEIVFPGHRPRRHESGRWVFIEGSIPRPLFKMIHNNHDMSSADAAVRDLGRAVVRWVRDHEYENPSTYAI